MGVSNYDIVSPIGSMYGIFTYICLICMLNVGKYTIHGSYGSTSLGIGNAFQLLGIY